MILLRLLPLLLLSSCSWVAFGDTEEVIVNSVPSFALVYFSTGEMCHTPCKIKYRYREPFAVTVAKPGFKPVTTPVDTRLSGKRSAAYAGDGAMAVASPILGVMGAGLSTSSKGTRIFSPNPIDVWLEPIAPDDKTTLTIEKEAPWHPMDPDL
jgi:hypothetical protein